MSSLFERPEFSREITGLVGPQQAPPIQPGPSQGVLGLAGPGVPKPPPPELQTRTVTQKGISPARAAAADFFTAFGGGPEAALIQQQRRFERPQRAFDIAQEQADKQTQLLQQKQQSELAQKRFGLSERDISLREEQAGKPNISTIVTKDGRRLITFNAETGELIKSLTIDEPISPQEVADFISSFENSLGSPLTANEQATISVAGQTALETGDLGVVASALDGISTGRQEFGRKKTLAKVVTDRQILADQRRERGRQITNDKSAAQAERNAILKENSAIRKTINTLKRDIFRKDITRGRKTEAENEIIRLRGVLALNETQITTLDKEIRQLSGKKSLRKQEEQGNKTISPTTAAQPGNAKEFIRMESGNR